MFTTKNTAVLLTGCYLFLFATALFSQKTHPTDTFPGHLGSASFLYHPQSKALLLIGAPVIPDSAKSNVWKWDGKTWTQIKATGPGSRDFFQGSLNKKTGQLHFFGGMMQTASGSKGDMWSFDGMKWSSVKSNDIGTRDHHNMVYMDHLDAFLVYGGNNNGYPNLDSTTWLFKDGQFKALNIPGPGTRYHYGLVYDKHRKKAVLYGGGEKPDEHWEFDGTKWTKRNLQESPGRKLYHQMVYNDDLKVTILHGGWINQNPRDTTNHQTPATWSWDGNTWKKIATADVFPLAMGYDAHRKVIVAYGFSDFHRNTNLGLWELKNNQWIQVADYGKWNTAAYITNWVAQYPDDLQALTKYADILQWQTKEFAKAETAYKRLLQAYPHKTDMLQDLALVLLLQNKAAEAETYLAQAKAAGLMNRYAYRRLAGLLSMEGRQEVAIPYLEIALDLEPQGADFYSLACSYALTGNKDKAFFNLDKAVLHGYHSKQQFESDTALESLKEDSRWQALLTKLQ